MPAMRRSESQDSKDCDADATTAALQAWGKNLLAASCAAKPDTPSLFLAEALVPSWRDDRSEPISHPQTPRSQLVPMIAPQLQTPRSQMVPMIAPQLQTPRSQMVPRSPQNQCPQLVLRRGSWSNPNSQPQTPRTESPRIPLLALSSRGARPQSSLTKKSSGTCSTPAARIDGEVSVNVSGTDLRDLRRACEAALTEALTPVTAGEGLSVAVRPTNGNGKGKGIWMGRTSGPLQFGFSVVPNNPHDVEMLREALLFEAACVGAFRLLPCLVAQLASYGAISMTHLQVVGLNVQPSTLSYS